MSKIIIVTIIVLIVAVVGVIVFQKNNPSAGPVDVNNDSVVPDIASTSPETKQAKETSSSDVQPTQEVVKKTPVLNTNNMTDQQNDPSTLATDAEVVAELKVLLPKIAALYSKDILTKDEEMELATLENKQDQLTDILNQNDTDGIAAILQVNAYGYDVNVKINGLDVGIKGGMSESSRLFNKEHYSYQLAAPAAQRLYVLKEGSNTIKIEYSQQKGESQLTSYVVITYKDQDILKVPLTDKQGSIEKTIILER